MLEAIFDVLLAHIHKILWFFVVEYDEQSTVWIALRILYKVSHPIVNCFLLFVHIQLSITS